MSTTHLKRIGAAVGVAAAALAVSTSAASATPLPPDDIDKYDCLLAVELLDQVNPLAVGGVLCHSSSEEAEQPTDIEPPDSGNGSDTADGNTDTTGGDDTAPAGDGSGNTQVPGTDTPGNTDTPGTDTSGNTTTPGDGSGPHTEPGPDGPGNSENAPGHDGSTPADKHSSGSENATEVIHHSNISPVANSHGNSPTPGDGREQLAETGSHDQTALIALAGGAMITLGAGAVAYTRRRT